MTKHIYQDDSDFEHREYLMEAERMEKERQKYEKEEERQKFENRVFFSTSLLLAACACYWIYSIIKLLVL